MAAHRRAQPGHDDARRTGRVPRALDAEGRRRVWSVACRAAPRCGCRAARPRATPRCLAPDVPTPSWPASGSSATPRRRSARRDRRERRACGSWTSRSPAPRARRIDIGAGDDVDARRQRHSRQPRRGARRPRRRVAADRAQRRSRAMARPSGRAARSSIEPARAAACAAQRLSAASTRRRSRARRRGRALALRRDNWFIEQPAGAAAPSGADGRARPMSTTVFQPDRPVRDRAARSAAAAWRPCSWRRTRGRTRSWR